MLALMVYRKSLRLQHVSKGNAANVMNVDPSRVMNGFPLRWKWLLFTLHTDGTRWPAWLGSVASWYQRLYS